MKGALAAALLLLCACGVEEPAKAPGPPKKSVIIPPPSDEGERSGIAGLARGATVISRTGEALLETSAIAAIDGDPASYWANLPKDFPQSLVVALAAPAHVEKIGVRTPAKAFFVPKEIVVEASMDGRAFRPLATLHPKAASEPQWFDATPADAAFLRVTVTGPSVDGGEGAINSILVRGRELAPARPGAIDGCWNVNGRSASFQTRGAHTAGAMQYARDTLYLGGGSNGVLHRFEWIRGAEFGYAVIAVSPDGRHLNGVQWHEEIVPLFVGDAWFGDRGTCSLEIKDDIAGEFLKRAGRHSLYDLRFAADGTLDAAASAEGLEWLVAAVARYPHCRLVAHEFREKTPAANRARAQRALDSLVKALQNAGVEPHRMTPVVAGSDNARQIPGSEAARELYSTIDLEVGT